VYAWKITKIGQLHRYSPYDRFPISTSGFHENHKRSNLDEGCTTTSTATSDAMETTARFHRYTDRSVSTAWVNDSNSTARATRPTPSSSAPAPAAGALRLRHGRHRNAAPAPSSRPLERVNVERYSRLMRASVSCGSRAIHQVMSITNAAAPSNSALRFEARPRTRDTARKPRGHSRYHCSSTARLHRWRSGERLPKYCAPPTIWPQLAR
jgi:hypothetical protein